MSFKRLIAFDCFNQVEREGLVDQPANEPKAACVRYNTKKRNQPRTFYVSEKNTVDLTFKLSFRHEFSFLLPFYKTSNKKKN